MTTKKKKILMAGCLSLAMLILGGFGIYQISQRADEIEKSAGFHPFEWEYEYTENEDGTYTCRGGVYQYKIAVTGGRSRGAVEDSTFVVLTNDKDISFDTVFGGLISNECTPLKRGEYPEYIILGWY